MLIPAQGPRPLGRARMAFPDGSRAGAEKTGPRASSGRKDHWMRAGFTPAVLTLLVAGGVVFPLRAAAPAAPPPAGTIVTVAGNGKDGYAGDNGPASKAVFLGPLGLAVDAAGDLLVGDFFNNRVRMIRPDGTITTIAGNGQPLTSGDSHLATKAGGGHPADGFGDGGLATQASMASVGGIALDKQGNLFICDYDHGRIRKVGLDGMISTVAGGGNPVDGIGDGGLATEAQLASPHDVL